MGVKAYQHRNLRVYQDADKEGKTPPQRGIHADAQHEHLRDHPHYQETEYKQEIDELGNTFKGIDLIEVALAGTSLKSTSRSSTSRPGHSSSSPVRISVAGISRTCSPSCAGSRRVKRPGRSRRSSFLPAAWTRLCSTGSLPRTTRNGSSKPSKDSGCTRCLPGVSRRQRRQVLFPYGKRAVQAVLCRDHCGCVGRDNRRQSVPRVYPVGYRCKKHPDALPVAG